MRLPIKKMTRQEFEALPKGADLNLYGCRLGTWFVCAPNRLAPYMIVIGHIVEGEDLFADRWGAGFSIPERGINRYRLEITN